MQLKRLNLETGSERQPRSERDWVGRLIELELKDLRQETLTPQEARFLAQAELAGWAASAALVDAILDYGLPAASEDAWRVAAASSAPLYDQVLGAIQEGQESFPLQVNGDLVTVLRIDAAEGRVEPLYVEGYTYWVARRGGHPEAVGRFGGIFLRLEDLRGLAFTYEPATKTIRLSAA